MDFQLERQVVEYSIGVFNYFNGRVNRYIPAKLNIRNKLDKSILGNNMFNVVNLYLWNIIDHSNNDINQIKVNIIFNVIHELSHVEQNIDYIRYNQDNNYRIMKENENNFNTYNFLYENLYQIGNDLNVLFDQPDIYNNYLYFSKYPGYEKFTLEEYYKRCIKTLTSNDTNGDTSAVLDEAFKYDNIIFVLNDTKILIKESYTANPNAVIFNKAIEGYNNTNMGVSTTSVVDRGNTVYIMVNLYLSYKFNIG